MKINLNWADKAIGVGSAFLSAASVLYTADIGNTLIPLFLGASDEAAYFKALAMGTLEIISALSVAHLSGQYAAYGRAYLRTAEEQAPACKPF